MKRTRCLKPLKNVLQWSLNPKIDPSWSTQGMIRMKVRCEVCGSPGQLQHLSENYYRVKHYLGSVNGKLRFEYHKQSLEYIKGVLDTSEEHKDIDPIDQKNIDPNLLNVSCFNENRRAGSLARLGHLLDVQKVAGSSPVRPTKTGPERFHLGF